MRYTEKSRYFAITEFHNFLITRSQRLFFNYLRSDLRISSRSDRKKEKNVVSLTHAQNIICSLTQLDAIAHEQTIIWRQSFTGNVVANKKEEKSASNDNTVYAKFGPRAVCGSNRLYYYGRLENKELRTAKLSRPEKKWRFSTHVQKKKLGILSFCRITWRTAASFHFLALTTAGIQFLEKW